MPLYSLLLGISNPLWRVNINLLPIHCDQSFQNNAPVVSRGIIPRGFHTKVSYQAFIPRLHTKVSYQGFIPRFPTKVAYKGFISRFHTKVAYQGFIPRFHTKVSYQGFIPRFIPRFHTKVLYQGCISRFHTKVSYRGFIPRFHIMMIIMVQKKPWYFNSFCTKLFVEFQF